MNIDRDKLIAKNDREMLEYLIQAMQYNGINSEHVINQLGLDIKKDVAFTETGGMLIKTLEGDMLVRVDDFVIKGVQGEFYPCKPDIFKATYESVILPI